MAQMTDTEGKPLPLDWTGDISFDLDLWGDLERGPHFLLSVPDRFECPGGVYDSAGVLVVDFKVVMEEYLERCFIQDGGESIPDFVSWLRSYADRLESAYRKYEDF